MNKLGKKILIVENYKGIRFLLSEVFKNHGYQVEVAVGKEFLQKMVQFEPRLLIIDEQVLQLCNINHIKELIKENHGELLVTSTCNVIRLKQLKDLRLTLINKPFDIEEILSVVKRLINTQEKEMAIKPA